MPVHALEQVALLVEPPRYGSGERLDVDVGPGLALIRVEWMEADEGRDHAVCAAPVHVRLPEAGAHRPAVAVGRDHVGRALAQDRWEHGLFGPKEERASGLEQGRGLDVLAGQVDVDEAELLEHLVPGVRRDLSEAQLDLAFSRERARSMF